MPVKCYLCGKDFDGIKTVKHGEHVIQNAIGGSLISPEILCEKCGGRLGDSVDNRFASALSPLTVLLQLPRDRGDYSQAKAQLVANSEDAAKLEQWPFVLKSDFSVIPRRPMFFESGATNTVTVLGATLDQAKQFSKSPDVQSALSSGKKLELSANAAEYAQSLLLTMSPDSIQVLRGVLKIAIGFASHNGVKREVIEHLIIEDKGKENLISSEPLLRSIVFPYYPTIDTERLFETDKHTHEDWYPTHHLYLFSQGCNLYCYVELFGAIQKFVHLSDKYKGAAILRKFVQKAERWDFDEDMFTAGSWKDLHLLAGQFQVEMGQRSFEEIQTDVLNSAKARAYALEPNNTIEKVQALTLQLANFSMLKNTQKFEIVQSLFAKADAAKKQYDLTLLDRLRENPMIGMQLIRYNYEEFRMGTIKSSRPVQVRKIPQVDLEKYVAYKFYELLQAKGRESLLRYEFI